MDCSQLGALVPLSSGPIRALPAGGCAPCWAAPELLGSAATVLAAAGGAASDAWVWAETLVEALAIGLDRCGFNHRLSAASATKNNAAGKLTPARDNPSTGGNGPTETRAAGGMLARVVGSLPAGRRLTAAVVGMEGAIGAGSESAMLSATSTVAMTLVTAG